jgi:hypothetical protein
MEGLSSTKARQETDMKILDLKKSLKSFYQPSAKKPEIIEVPRFQFARIDGVIEKKSEPGKSPAFAEATQALYGISYTLKFMLKKRNVNPIDYPVMALEGLWWVEDGRFDITVKDNWHYTLMILQPEVITPALFAQGLEEIRRKKGGMPALSKLRLGYFEEGLTVQMMHIGPYATEPATLATMLACAAEQGYRDRVGRGGKHHEIYLGDPRKADPSKLKTVLRHPVGK